MIALLTLIAAALIGVLVYIIVKFVASKLEPTASSAETFGIIAGIVAILAYLGVIG